MCVFQLVREHEHVQSVLSVHNSALGITVCVQVSVAVDQEDNIYVADARAHAIFVILAADNARNASLALVAGDGIAGVIDGPGYRARFVEPYAVAISPDGQSLMVADKRACLVRHIRLVRPVGSDAERETGVGDAGTAADAGGGKREGGTKPGTETGSDGTAVLSSESTGHGDLVAGSLSSIQAQKGQSSLINKKLESLFDVDLRLLNRSQVDALKSKIQDAGAPQDSADLSTLDSLLHERTREGGSLGEKRVHEEDAELARLTDGLASRLNPSVQGAVTRNAEVDALKEQLSSRLVGALAAPRTSDDAQGRASSRVNPYMNISARAVLGGGTSAWAVGRDDTRVDGRAKDGAMDVQEEGVRDTSLQLVDVVDAGAARGLGGGGGESAGSRFPRARDQTIMYDGEELTEVRLAQIRHKPLACSKACSRNKTEQWPRGLTGAGYVRVQVDVASGPLEELEQDSIWEISLQVTSNSV